MVQLEDAERILAECDHVTRPYRRAPDVAVKVRAFDATIAVRPADLRKLADWARQDIRRQLTEAGYGLPAKR